MEVDLVYMWVDGCDPVWRARKASFMPEGGEPQRQDAAGDCRFVSNDELRYSLRSVEKFAPWVRRIYIVTDGQCPDWLDTSNPRVRIVDHREIFPAEVLPLYNSSAIEWGLPHIPGLAERFLLANDDTFFGAPVGPEFFYAPDGYPIVRLKYKRIIRHLDKIYPYKLHQAQLKISERFGKRFRLSPHHNIDAYCKSDFLACADAFREEVDRTLRNRFRDFGDLQRVVVLYYALALKRAHLRRVWRWGVTRNPLKIARALLGGKCCVDSRYFPACNKHLEKLYAHFNPALFCLNDDEHASADDRRRVRTFLEELFPEKSSFER